MVVIPRSAWTLVVLGTVCIIAAIVTQVVTLSWRNWIQIVVPWRNTTTRLQIGLWGACADFDHCYAFHTEGQHLPWHLQAAVFLSMICICLEVLILALCVVEGIFLWDRKHRFPLKKAQVYMAVLGAFLVVSTSAVMGLMAISGHEQDTWALLRSRMLLTGPEKLADSSRFSVSQAWGFQALSCVYFICYMLISKIQETHAVIHVELTVAAVHTPDPDGRRNRITVFSPTCTNPPAARTPPPLYSPPPAYATTMADHEQQETCLNFNEDHVQPPPPPPSAEILPPPRSRYSEDTCTISSLSFLL